MKKKSFTLKNMYPWYAEKGKGSTLFFLDGRFVLKHEVLVAHL